MCDSKKCWNKIQIWVEKVENVKWKKLCLDYILPPRNALRGWRDGNCTSQLALSNLKWFLFINTAESSACGGWGELCWKLQSQNEKSDWGREIGRWDVTPVTGDTSEVLAQIWLRLMLGAGTQGSVCCMINWMLCLGSVIYSHLDFS